MPETWNEQRSSLPLPFKFSLALAKILLRLTHAAANPDSELLNCTVQVRTTHSIQAKFRVRTPGLALIATVSIKEFDFHFLVVMKKYTISLFTTSHVSSTSSISTIGKDGLPGNPSP